MNSRLSLLSLACLAVASSAALAQQDNKKDTSKNDSKASLEAVLVTGHAAQTGLDADAGSSSRLGLSLRETPASVSVVDRSTIEARGAVDTQDILKSVPGVSFSAQPGSPGSVFYRGFGASSLAQLYNGISVQYDAIAARPVESWIVDRVEAIGGASSFLNGSGAVGGSINVITKLADASGDNSRLRFAVGDRPQVALGLQRNLADGRHVLRLDAARSDGALWTQGADREAHQVAGSWRARLTAALSHTLALETQHEKVSRPYWGTPMQRAADGTVSGELQFNPALLGINYNVVDGRYEQDVQWLRSITEWQLAPKTRFTHTLYHYDALREFENLEVYTLRNANTQVQRSEALLQRHDQQVWGSRSELSHSGMLAGLRSDFAAGLDWSYNRQTRFPRSVSGPFDTTSATLPAELLFYQLPGMSSGYSPGATNLLRSLALFAENRTVLGGGYALVSALRWDRISLDVRNHRTVTATNPALFTTRFTPMTGRLGLMKDISKDWQVYAQASTAADPPSGLLATAGFSALRDFDLTRGRQFEVGSKLGFDQGRGQATLALYEIRRKNLSMTDPADRTRVIPIGEQSSQGVELTAGWQPAQRWSLQAQLAYTKARYENFAESSGSSTVSRAGNTPPNVPTWVAGAWINWQPLDTLGLGLDWRYVGRRFGNTANTLWDGAYHLLGAQATLKLDRNTTLKARVDNLNDQVYAATVSASLPYLGAPRSVQASIDWAF
ncbi:TonB-dependent receptor [Roseateles sp.]|jgi:iron complex outermembrane receptor protein|uniref:TonB-dependent receptor n=1 Tax=Roseateles sp. TaxID=1971397 RepID=UPI0037C581E6